MSYNEDRHFKCCGCGWCLDCRTFCSPGKDALVMSSFVPCELCQVSYERYKSTGKKELL